MTWFRTAKSLYGGDLPNTDTLSVNKGMVRRVIKKGTECQNEEKNQTKERIWVAKFANQELLEWGS